MVRIPLDPVQEQDQRLKNILDRITVESVDRLTRTVGFKTLSLKSHDKSQGVINCIYFVTVEHLESGLNSELVLRVTNPWKRWTRIMQSNEAKILEIINRWNDTCQNEELCIPVPKLISFSADASTSILGCEYSLVTKVGGINAADVKLEEWTHEQRQVLWKDFLRVLTALKSIPADFVFQGVSPDLIPTFAKTFQSFGSLPHASAPLLQDGHPLPALQSFGAIHVCGLATAIADMEESDTLRRTLLGHGDVDRLIQRFKDLHRKLMDGEIDKDRLWPTPSTLAIAHDDMHLGNLHVDPSTGRIVAVLDWDRTHWGTHDDFAQDWASCICDDLFKDDNDAAAAQEELEKLYPDCEDIKTRYQWRTIGDRAMWLTNIVATWLGKPIVDPTTGLVLPRSDSTFFDIHKEHYDNCVEILDELDEFLRGGDLNAESSDEPA